MKILRHMLIVMIAGIVAGCASFEFSDYVPRQAGSLDDASGSEQIAVSLRPDAPSIRRGDNLGFSVAIRNISGQTVVLPKNPDVMLTWIYPDGQRDNLIRGESDAAPGELVKLDPGQEMIRHSTIKTYYFHRSGITEFRAIVSAAGPADAWSGRAISNGYGVMID